MPKGKKITRPKGNLTSTKVGDTEQYLNTFYRPICQHLAWIVRSLGEGN